MKWALGRIRKTITFLELTVILILIGYMGSLLQVAGDSIMSDMALEALTQKIVSDIDLVRFLAMKHGGQGAYAIKALDGSTNGLQTTEVFLNPNLQFWKIVNLPTGLKPETYVAGPINLNPWGTNYLKGFHIEAGNFEDSWFTFTGLDNNNEVGAGVGKHFNYIDQSTAEAFFLVSFDNRGKLSNYLNSTESHLFQNANIKISDGTRNRTITVFPNGMIQVTKS